MTTPPHDCRSRGDCGGKAVEGGMQDLLRLTIAAVAATAATYCKVSSLVLKPPHDCRSRGDCGSFRAGRRADDLTRLTIAAVAATAARRFCC